MKIIEGHFQVKDKKIAIVASRFNSFIVERLIEGAKDSLVRHGISEDNLHLYRISGAFEFAGFLSLFLKRQAGNYDAIICLGAVIRGETPHFDYVAAEATKAIAQMSMNAEIPIIYGILTTDSVEQAIDRAGTKSGNKGEQASMSALEMIDLYSKL